MKLVVLGFGIIISCLLILIKLAEFSYWQRSSNLQYILVAFGVVCLIAGLILRKSPVIETNTRTEFASSEQSFSPDIKVIEKLGLSKRECQILELINQGLSNQQIADKIFLSESTIKKHVSSILLKMDVERRTEAIRKGKDIGILK